MTRTNEAAEAQRDKIYTDNLQLQDLQRRVLELEAQNQALERTAHQLSARFEQAPAAFLVLNDKGVIQDANSQACALLEYSCNRHQGRSVSQFIAGESRTSYEQLIKQATASPSAQVAELQLQLSDAPALHVCVNLVARQVDRQFEEYLLTLMDITAHHVAREALLLDQEHLEQQLPEFTSGLRAQENDVEEIVQPLSGEVHAAVHRAAGFIDLLHRDVGWQSDTTEQHFERARRALEHAAQLMVALRGYERVNRARVRLRNVNLNKVLDAVQQDLVGQYAHRNVKITCDTLPTVQGDSQSLHLVFKELLSNALKFTSTREEARIRLLVRVVGEETQIGVEDNGVGLNMRHKDKLFRVFKRLHPSGTFEGAGVGLAVVRRVWSRFGARVWAEGKQDVGATFWVGWPKQPVMRSRTPAAISLRHGTALG